MPVKELLEKIESGQVAPREGLELYKKLQKEPAGAHFQILYYTGGWKKSEAENNDISGNDSSPVLIFDTDETLFHLYREESRAENVILIRPGETYQAAGNNVYHLNPEKSDDYSALTQEFYERNIIPARIIYLWSKADNLANHKDPVSRQLAGSVCPIFYLTRALMAQNLKQDVRLLYVYKTTQNENPFHSAVSGFARAVRMERPGFLCRTVAVDDLFRDIYDKTLREFQTDDTATEVRYHGEKRQVKYFRDFDPKSESAGSIPLKESRVYLITGGLGELGLIFAEYLARKWKARLVLTGRSELSSGKEAKLGNIRKTGSEIVHIRADVSDPEHVQKLMSEIRTRFGTLDGIIHGAGVIRDALILKKKKADMDAVFSPKVRGAVYLDEATRDDSLDFFVFFSSTTSITGNSGQVDYAYANCFMDHFAGIREQLRKGGKRSGKTLSVNWPLWKDGGMQVPGQTQEWLEKTLGLYALPTDAGLDAFEKGLVADVSQLIVFNGKPEKIRKLLGQKEPKPEKEERRTQVQADETELICEVQKKISEIASAILKVGDADIDPNADMSEYGFDSFSLTALVNRINDAYDLELMPAVFFEHSTVGSFAEYLCETYKDALLPHHQNALQASNIKHQTSSIKHQTSELIREVQKKISEIASVILKVGDADIDPDAEMSEYGFDSFSLTALVNRINDAYDLELMPAVFFEHPTVSSFAEYLCETYKDALLPHHQDALHQASNIKHQASNIQHQTSSIKHPASNIKHQTSSIKHQTSNIKHQTSSIKHQASSIKHQTSKDDPVAIIGMSAVMPGSDDLDTFWEHLKNGDDLVTEIPSDRWDWRAYYGDPLKEPDKTDRIWGAFINDADKFDASFFNISPREAERMDPQHRIFLETVWKCIEDAGYKPSDFSGTKTGLFAGIGSSDYHELMLGLNIAPEIYTSTGTVYSVLTNRISYLLNLHGPSEPVDTACSSGMFAVHRAVMAIKNRECDAAIAGAVNLILNPRNYIAFSKAGVLSAEGRCKTFDKKANGYVRGEGTGAVLLKPLSQAMADRDQIYGIIKAVSVNHGGHVSSLTVPNPNAQAALLVDAYEKAGVDPAGITYIEAHGTGTVLGDPVEINGLKKAFKTLYEKSGRRFSRAEKHCGLGSVKTNIGHTEAAAGIAGLLKVLLSMKHKTLPRSVHFEEINPQIQLEESPFYIVSQTMPWAPLKDGEDRPIPRMAGISSFGFGGANAHLVLEEGPESAILPSPDSSPRMIPLSAKNEERLRVYAGRMADFLKKHEEKENRNPLSLAQVAYTLQTGRESMDTRLAIIVSDIHELGEKLSQFAQGEKDAAFFYGDSRKENPGLLIEGEEGETYLSSIIAKKKFDKLARVWVSGADIEWKLLYSEGTPGRISLPSYPFARERYWIADSETSGAYSHKPASQGECLCFCPIWEKSEIRIPKSESRNPNPIFLFDTDKVRKEAIGEKLTTEIILVKPGKEFADEGQFYEINPGHPGDYVRLLTVLGERNLFPNTLVHLWSITDTELAESDSQSRRFEKIGPEDVRTCLDAGIYSVYYLIRAISEVCFTSLSRILFLFNGEKEASDPFSEAVSGYSESLRRILPEFSLSTVRILPGPDRDRIADIVSQEMVAAESSGASAEIRYENRERYTRTIRPLTLNKTGNLPLKQGGTYLITGGAGGLGLIFARYLAENCQAKLALTGRSVLSRKANAIDELRQSGSEVLYFQADAADADKMKGVIRTVREQLGPLNGVIHAAGVASVSPLTHKTPAEFESTLRPKIQGTIILDRVTRAESLDFFILFSSTSAVLGDFGQCDYAVANRFMDAFAEVRTALTRTRACKGRTLVINWPLWRKGGMHLDPDTEALHIGSSGTALLETEKGLDAFERILKNRHSQVILFPPAAKLPKATEAEVLKFPEAKPAEPAEPRHPGKLTESDLHTLPNHVISEVQEIAADILITDVRQLDPDEGLGNFGFDSITFKMLADKICETFEIEISPSVFFAHSDIRGLSEYLLETFNAQICERYAEPVVPEMKGWRETEKIESLNVRAPQNVRDSEYSESFSTREPTAVIGMHGVFPESRNLSVFWKNLVTERDLITEVPRDRWKWEDYYTDPVTGKDRPYMKWGGFIPDADKFDPLFFKISPREAEVTDPQQRVFIETVWKTVEDGGYRASDLSGKAVGVFAAVQFDDYQRLLSERNLNNAQTATGNAHAMISNRISFLMNWHGPSETINTACSGSLTSVHRAVQSLRSGECEMAVAGGVSLMLYPGTVISTGQLGVLSPDGRCKTFDERADGFVKGEGSAALLLKPLSKAIADGDHIYAVIRGSAVNHGGAATSLTAPNSQAQAALLVSAYKDAGIESNTVSFLELHGTGTELGDPVEVEGIKSAFKILAEKCPCYDCQTAEPEKPEEPSFHYCGLGSVKTNMGHAEPASGVAGMIKVVLGFRHRKLPGTPHFQTLNPYIELRNSPFYVVEKTRDWKRLRDENGNPVPRRAGVSSFGFGGANAHVVLEEGPETTCPSPPDSHSSQQLILLSARNEERLRAYAGEMADFFDTFSCKDDCGEQPETFRSTASPTLAQIAYTLHAGRDSMEERLAVIVSDISELKEKLTQYVQNRKDVKNLYAGNIKAAGVGAGLLVEGKEGAEFIRIVTQERKLGKLAQLWVSGVETDPGLLYPPPRPQRISLPTYPFARERYWIPETDSRDAESGTHLPRRGTEYLLPSIHPLLERNTSTLKEQKYTTLLNGSEFYLRDHIVAGQKTFPGVAYIEMARAAGSAAGEQDVRQITNIVWSQPVTVSDTSREVSVSLYPQADGANFRVSTTAPDGEAQVHAHGKLKWENGNPAPDPEPLDIKGIMSRCEKRTDHGECYEKFQAAGLRYGPGFQPIQEISVNRTQAISRLELPASLGDSFGDYGLHPTLTDGALQTVSGLLDRQTSGTPYVPFVLGEVTLIKPLTESCYAYTVSAGETPADAGIRKFHIDILNPEGDVLIRMRDFSVRPLTTSADIHTPMYVHSVWEKTDIPTCEFQFQHPILLFDVDETRADALQMILKTDVILVRPGENWEQTDQRSYIIHPDRPSDYHKLLTTLSQEDMWPRHIIHLWSRDPFDAHEEKLNTQIQTSLFSMFHLTRALLKQKPAEKIRIMYLHIGSSDDPQPQYAALGGFARTLSLENPNLNCKTVTLPDLSRAVGVIATELQADDGVEIRYQEGCRWIRKLKETGLDSAPDIRTLLKQNGVYLLTGGAGGLGLIFAEYLAREVNARLILAGRSELTPEQTARIQSLKDSGAEVLYIQADISKRDSVEKLIAQAKSCFAEINGVIHAAGLTRDAYIPKKTPDEISAVLAPKVMGAIRLDEALKSEPLDFFVMFSSVTAVMGNAGQSDYAYANSFMDHFAEMREQLRFQKQRFGKTLSINWPLWESGGMRVDEQVRTLVTGTMGMIPLKSSHGWDAFVRGLGTDHSQIMVIQGDRGKIKRALGLASEKARASVSSPQADTGKALRRLGKELLSMVSDILKIDEADISIDEDISEYGFDSINFTELANRINEKFRLEITPVIFFEYPSLDALSENLWETFSERLSAHWGEEKTEPSRPAVPAVDAEDIAAKASAVRSRFQKLPEQRIPAGPTRTDIAIIGMSGMMPQSRDPEQFWEHLEAGHDLISEVPEDRWEWKAYYGDTANKTRAIRGGFMPDVHQFDCMFFGISPREAELMDPQQRIFMQMVWKAIEDAGYRASDLSGTRTGLFVGVSSNDYFEMFHRLNRDIEPYFSTGMAHSVLANRISYLLNLRGPSEPIDTACSGSLIAIHRAVEAIHSGTCNMAIAGGVNVMLTPTLAIAFDKAGMLSKDGRCKTFDKDADGYVRGEGVGALLLKPLDQARTDRDHVYAVIRGTAENHGGHAASLTAPNPKAQAELLVRAYKTAGISPETVTYIETHGTGTALGDPIEIRGLKAAFSELYEKQGKSPAGQHCGLGAVKTNIGHLEAAAGIAGILKVLLSMKYRKLPPTIHFNALNPYIELEESPFYITTELRDWEPLKDAVGRPVPRRAGISSFGFGGANAHIVLEEWPILDSDLPDGDPRVIVLSAKDEERLRSYAGIMAEFIKKSEKGNALPYLADFAYTLQVGRDPMEVRIATVVSDMDELKEKLIRYAQGESEIEDFYFMNIRDAKPGIGLLIDGEAGQAFFRVIMEKKELNKIAQIWISGTEIDWKLLYPGKMPARISLPTYPFGGERYSIPHPGPRIPTSVSQDPIPELRPSNLYFQSVWEKSKTENRESDIEIQNSVILFDTDENRQRAFQEKLDTDVILVRPGNRFAAAPGDRVFSIDPDEAEDYVRLLNALKKEDREPALLLHLWSLSPGDNGFPGKEISDELVDTCLSTGIYSVFHFVRAVSELEFTTLNRILFLFNGEKEAANPFMEAVSGYSESLVRVLPDLSLSTIRVLPGRNGKSIPDVVMQELSLKGDPASEICYEDGERYIRSIRELELKDLDVKDLRDFKNLGGLIQSKRGVYLITGGAGGLGMIFARYLAETYQARLILTGRSKLEGEREARVSELRQRTGSVLYLQADVSDQQAMAQVIETAGKAYGPLNGVIHAAGIVSANPVTRKDAAEFEATLKPKIHGAIILDRVTRDEHLDFFILFSSTSAVLGDFGQCDYAVANRFLVSFARMRESMRQQQKRHGRTLAIAWPLWREGGLHGDPEAENFYLSTSGLSYLETANGLEAFENILGSGASQVILMPGDPDRIRQMLCTGQTGQLVSAASPESGKPLSSVGETDPELRILSEIQNIASHILKIEPEKLDPGENLGGFGFDSISLKMLADDICETFQIEILPSVFFAHSDIRRLGAYLLETYPEIRAYYDARPGEEQAEQEMTDSEAEFAAVPETVLSPRDSGRVSVREKTEPEPVPVISETVLNPGDSGRVSAKGETEQEPIAVIGMHGIFPGSKTLAEFWRNLESQADMITEIPKKRWNWEAYYGDPDVEKNKIHSKWGGFITNADKFDPRFFRITPHEARLMDPQHRLFTETVWKTVEDAGYRSSELSGRSVGVFAGMQFNDYYQLLMLQNENDAQIGTGNADAMLANRISFLMDWHGPSESIDTACSSSLVAVHRAVKSIHAGECEMAVAGGVSLMLHPGSMIAAGQLGILSPDGRCKTFDKSADGYVKGEGVAAVLLKPLSRAVADHDNIYAVIRGSAVNHGGRASSLTAPNSEAQADLLVSAYGDAGISPETVTFLELHGTGTELGDPVEIEGIKKAFELLAEKNRHPEDNKPEEKKTNQKTYYCGLGSVKTNIGHLEPAAGIAGMIKVILAMQNRKLPGTPHFQTLNPYIKLHDTPFYVVEKTRDWERLRGENGNPVPRRAGISSFGFGGANAHVILEEGPETSHHSVPDSHPSLHLILLSARNEERLRAYAAEMKDFSDQIAETENPVPFSLENMAYTLQTGREQMAVRLAIAVSDIDELKDRLTRFVQGDKDIETLYQGKVGRNKAGLLIEGEERDAYISSLIRKKNIGKLAQMWVSGAEIDWRLLYSDGTRTRVSLPTYPFARERYWIETKGRQHAKSGNAERLHPLIDGMAPDLSLARGGVVFQKQLKQSDPILSDHRIHDRPVLPGAAYLEMIYAATGMIRKETCFRISRMVWHQPLVTTDDKKTVHILIREKGDRLGCQIQAYDGDQVITHATGEIVSDHEKTPEQRIPIEAIKAGASCEIDRKTLYRGFQKTGLCYGDYFQGLKQIWGNNEEALGLICIPRAYEDELSSYTLHPALTDAALQTVAGIASHPDDTAGRPLLVPFAVESVEILHPPEASGYAYITTAGPHRFHLAISDETGRVCVKFRDVSFKVLPEPLQDFFYEPRRVRAEEEHDLMTGTRYPEGEKDDTPSLPGLRTPDLSLTTEEVETLPADAPEDRPGNPVLSDGTDPRTAAVEKIIAACVSDVLGVEIEEIDREGQFSDYGVDSLTGIRLVNKVTSIFDITLRITIIFDYANIKELASYLCAEYREKISEIVSENIREEHSEPPEITTSDILFHEEHITKPESPLSDIAIIGMSGRFPDADNIWEFWQNLAAGKDSVTGIPEERRNAGGYYEPEPDRTYSIRGGFLKDIDKFDPLFFNMSGREAELTDPRQRIFLQECWTALEDAGYAGEAVSGMRCGVFAGVSEGDYQTRMEQAGVDTEPQTFWGNAASVLVSRIAYFLNLKGPAVAIDTACSSSLTAVHLACQSIRSGESEMALAGGVFVCITPRYYILAGNAGMLSSEGRCKAFDDSADGFVPGEGVAALILKPLDTAVKDGDHIYGVIKGSGLNQDGKTNGITAPSALSQTTLELSVYEKSGIHPGTITYVETHGTGTKLGDPIEIEALTKAFGKYTDKKGYCAVGSVKTNIGHAAAASGAASLIKVLLSFKYKQIPPSLNFKQENAYIRFRETPFYVNTRLQDWKSQENTPTRAAVSSFGFSGTNAHLVIEEYRHEQLSVSNEPQIILLSAKTRERLRAYAEKVADFLEKHKGLQGDFILRDMAWTLQTAREAMEERLAAVVSDPDELTEKLRRFAEGQRDTENLYFGNGFADKAGSADLFGENDVTSLIRKRENSKLAQLWVSGVKIDWNLLYSEQQRPGRMPLPTYPFAKERYWPEKPIVNRQPSTVSQQSLHPMIDSNESTLEEQCFKKVFQKEDFYLKDHIVGGEVLLPGAAFLEMARAAGNLARRTLRVKRLTSVIWTAPLKIGDTPKEVFISLWPDEERVEYEMVTISDGNGHRQVHARGKLIYENDRLADAERVDIEAIRDRCPERMTPEECYSLFQARGLRYGPAFQTIEDLWFNGSEALSHLRLPQQFRNDFHRFVLHPLLTDGAWQTLIGLADRSTEGTLYVPFALGETIVIRPLTQACYAYASDSSGGSRVRKFNIDILDETGQVLVKMKEFSMKAVSDANTANDDNMLQLLHRLAQGEINTEDVRLRV